MTREEYIGKLKARLDRWNEELTVWEAQAEDSRRDMKERYARELDVLKAQRELARYNLRLIEDASASAWKDLQAGADDAWDRMQAAVKSAGTWFAKR
jgi:hypothetical protein